MLLVDADKLTKIAEGYYLKDEPFTGVAVCSIGSVVRSTILIEDGSEVDHWRNPYLPDVSEILAVHSTVLKDDKSEMAPYQYNGKDFIGLSFSFSQSGFVRSIAYHYGISVHISDRINFAEPNGDISRIVYEYIGPDLKEKIDHIFYKNDDLENLIRPYFYAKWYGNKLTKAFNISTSRGFCEGKLNQDGTFWFLNFSAKEKSHLCKEKSYLLEGNIHYPFKIDKISNFLEIDFLFGRNKPKSIASGKVIKFSSDFEDVINAIDFSRCEELITKNEKLINFILDNFTIFPRLKKINLIKIERSKEFLSENPDIAQLIDENKVHIDFHLNDLKL